jgi:monoterpene epsilon-lactone hydrolase
VLLSPWVDLAGTGASLHENAASDDVIVTDEPRAFAMLYAGSHALTEPEISPLYARLGGLPPLLIQASRIEVLRDDAVRLGARARDAGADATVQLWDGVHHVWPLFTWLPESREALDAIGAFARRVRAPSGGLPFAVS